MKKSLYLAGACLLPGMALAAPQFSPTVNAITIEPHITAALRDMPAASATGTPRAIEMPRHRLPGFAVGRPSALPHLPDANVYVAPAGAATATATGFTGIYEGANAKAIGGELEPPDQGVAVNNNQIVEIVNNSIQVFDNTGKALTKLVSNGTFFGNASAPLSDPHVTYDPSVQRWFVEELTFTNAFTGFYVAVSQTSDPTGKYTVYLVSANTSKISGCGAQLCLPDYPQVGFDANGYYINADLFSNGTGQFVNASLYALPKATLVAGGTLANYVNFVLPEFVLQPSIPAPGQAFESGQNGTEYAMTARNIFDNSTNVRVYAITDTADIVSNPSKLKASFVDVKGEAYTGSVANTQPDVVGPYGKSVGAKHAGKLDGGYNAFGGGVKYAGNKLYGALTTGSTDKNGLARNVIAWFGVKPSVSASGVSATLAAQGYLVPATGYSVFYPDFALDNTGRGFLGASITNPDQKVAGGFPSTFYIKFKGTAVGTVVRILGQGSTSDDGFTCYNGSNPSVGRWGDYGGAFQDGATGVFYLANEFIPDATKYPRGHYANWGTFISAVAR